MPSLAPTFDPEQPPPAQNPPSLWALAFAWLGAPAAWAAQLLLGYGLAAHACFPKAVPLAAPPDPLWPWLAAISVLCIGLGLAACALAFRNWQVARQEGPGTHHRLLDVGEGRTRFLAMWGLLTSLMFLTALVFGSINLLWVPLCA